LKIFERSKRSVQLTPKGKELIEQGKKILSEAQTFIDLAMEKNGPLAGRFNLGAIATVGPYYFPYIIAPLRKAYPNLELIIHEGQTDDLLKKLDSGDLDAVIASRTFDETHYRIYTLHHEAFFLASPADLPIKNKLGRVSVKDIDRDKLILLTDGNCLKDEVLNFCGLTAGRSKTQGTSLETLRFLVASGAGYTLIPEFSLQENKKLHGLINYYPFQEKSAEREIVLVSREQYSRPDEIRLLYQKLKECSQAIKKHV
jgi:LysR family transcriptional regulator, hydrogen peroxide-inducible genes activator